MGTFKEMGLAMRSRLALGVGLLALALAVLGWTFATQASALVYWTNRDFAEIGRGNLDGSGINQSFITGAFTESGMAVDAEHVYWSGVESIGRANLNGTEVNNDFIIGAHFANAVAVNGEYIYWANSTTGTIGRANLDGTDVNQNFITGAELPTGVAVDGEHVYWANNATSTIGRANLDGTDVEQTFISAGGFTYGVAVNAEHVYWTSQDQETIGRANLDGTGANPNFITGAGETFGLALDAEHIYWANPASNEIGRANLNGTGANPDFITGSQGVYGVAANTGAPTATTGSASEVTPASAEFSARVNPNGHEVTECVFEYGTTTSYGKHVACSPSPGSGESPEAVSAAISELTPNTTYHFRVSATNAFGTSTSTDQTFATLESSESGSTLNPSVPATARDGELFGEASGGVGAITVGKYGSQIGGRELSGSSGAYIDVYLSAVNTFKEVKFKDCELDGGESMWWYDPRYGWEQISNATVMYTEGPPACITVTVTEHSSPDLAQLTGTRFGTRFGDNNSALQFGQCLALKGGTYADANCQTPDFKNGKPHGKYDWYPAPVGCYAKKKGFYTESECKTLDVKKGKVLAKGKYEAGADNFEATEGVTKLEIATIGTVQCKSGTSERGEDWGAKTAIEVAIYEGCAMGGHECSSSKQKAGTIRSAAIEIEIEDENPEKVAWSEKFFQGELPGGDEARSLLTFSCGDEEFALKGVVFGEIRDTNTMSTSHEVIFGPAVGEQELETETVANGEKYKTTLTTTEKIASTQAMEVDTKV